MITFKDLGLSEPILKAVAKKGYTKPSVIQEKAIPIVLEGKDVLASAQTGTGKTAGFVLPILDLISKHPSNKKRPIRSLILTPTRELAAQIYDNIKEYSLYLDIKSTVIFGGVKQGRQVATLKGGIDILVATPGRLLDLCNQKLLDLSQVQILVLDEADRMLDMGFIRDIKKIIALVPAKRQSLLFSATFSKEIRKLSNNYLKDPVSVAAAPENTTADKIKQKIYKVDKTRKTALIIKLISEGQWKQVLVFTRTKHGANRLCKKMEKQNISASAIHGNKTQNARVRALADFKEGKVRVLVATDIAARGLDIPLLPHVINFELPNIAEDYVHRIGRTGRAGASGEAISLVCNEEYEYVESIEKLLKITMKTEVVEGFEPENTIAAKPPKKQPHVLRKPKQNKWGNKKKNNNNNNRNDNNRNKPKNENANKTEQTNRSKKKKKPNQNNESSYFMKDGKRRRKNIENYLDNSESSMNKSFTPKKQEQKKDNTQKKNNDTDAMEW